MGLQIVLRVLNLFGLGRAARRAPPVRFGRAKSRAPYWALWAGLMLVACAATARADVYQWQWVDSGDPTQGVEQSSTLCPDGAGAVAAPNANLYYLDLTQAYLIGVNLQDANLYARRCQN
ncbi:MAG: hypothetical protein ACLQLG_05650 [Thermoguttaceae bacterium]